MKITLWGTRGSIATPGPDTARYGGNTSCVEVRGIDGTVLVLDAGTGIRPLGAAMPADVGRIDILLTHLHLDHILGLGFFAPLYNPNVEVHIWGPASSGETMHARLTRYLSPPLFPVHLSELPCALQLHEVPCGTMHIGEFTVDADFVCHPGPTVGYRIQCATGVATYMPDHEPALGGDIASIAPEWISGFALARNADVLIHDAQYVDADYPAHVGWGHSSISHVVAFARRAGVKRLVPFHHDPSRTDAMIDSVIASLDAAPVTVIAAGEGTTIVV